MVLSFENRMIYALAPLGAEQVINWKQMSAEKKKFPDDSPSNRQNIIYSVEKVKVARLLFFNTLKKPKNHTPESGCFSMVIFI